jgi:hypothetical protein
MTGLPTSETPSTAPNPATEARPRRPRIPMSTARQKLQAREIPGYHLHWFREDNVDAALDAAYEFVNPEEVHLNQLNVANAAKQAGGTDMGSRVSLIADKNEQGTAVRAYLMKIKVEFYKDDQREIAQKNSSILEAMFGDEAVQGDVAIDDSGRVIVKGRDPLTYVDPDRTGIMNRKVRKARSIGRGRLTG